MDPWFSTYQLLDREWYTQSLKEPPTYVISVEVPTTSVEGSAKKDAEIVAWLSLKDILLRNLVNIRIRLTPGLR